MAITLGSMLHALQAAVRRDWQRYALLVAVFITVPGLLVQLLVPLPTPDAMAPEISATVILALFGNALLTMIGGMAVIKLAGRPPGTPAPRLGSAIASTGKPLLKLVAIMLLLNIVAGIVMAIAIIALGVAGVGRGADPTTIALVLLAISGIAGAIIGARLMPLAGVLMFEARGIFASLRRAWALTRGHMRPLLGVEALSLVIFVPLTLLRIRLRTSLGAPGDSLAATLAALVLALAGLVLNLYLWVVGGTIYRQFVDAEADGDTEAAA